MGEGESSRNLARESWASSWPGWIHRSSKSAVMAPFIPPGRASPRSTAEASIGPQRLALPGAPWRNSALRLPGPPSFRRGSGRRLHRDPRDPRGQWPSSTRQEVGPGAGPRGEPQCWLAWVGPAARIPGGGGPASARSPPASQRKRRRRRLHFPEGSVAGTWLREVWRGRSLLLRLSHLPLFRFWDPLGVLLRPGRLAAAHAQVQRTVHPNNHPPTRAFRACPVQVPGGDAWIRRDLFLP